MCGFVCDLCVIYVYVSPTAQHAQVKRPHLQRICKHVRTPFKCGQWGYPKAMHSLVRGLEGALAGGL